MSAMAGVSSEGACSVGDPIFLPLENALGKRPAKYVSARHVSIFAVLQGFAADSEPAGYLACRMQACCCKCKLLTRVLWM